MIELDDRALNRALLARQGLLERFDAPLVDVVEAIGAMQGQAWAALPVGLWTRMTAFAPADLYNALAAGRLRWGIGLRGTLHLVSAREHPAYATVATTDGWQRALDRPSPGMDALRAALLAFAEPEARTNEELRAFAEAWVAERLGAIDPAEVQAQRALRWRPVYRWSALVREPKDGAWGARTPPDHRAAPAARPVAGAALEQVARRHLGAFGPAAAEDVACWTGRPTGPVRELLERLELERFRDAAGRTLYDLPGAARPDPDTPAPPRLLGAFDSTLLAYVPKRRERIVSAALRDVVYQGANLQIRPSFLVDGRVAGIWSIEVRRREATLTLCPAGRLAAAPRRALEAEAEGLLEALHPGARAHRVAVA